MLGETRRRALPEPNIDFALATLAGVAGMIPGAGEAIFAVARTAGWIAHAMEEYAKNAPLRPRTVYTGPVTASQKPPKLPAPRPAPHPGRPRTRRPRTRRPPQPHQPAPAAARE